VRAGACRRVVECAEVVPVLQYVTESCDELITSCVLIFVMLQCKDLLSGYATPPLVQGFSGVCLFAITIDGMYISVISLLVY